MLWLLYFSIVFVSSLMLDFDCFMWDCLGVWIDFDCVLFED